MFSFKKKNTAQGTAEVHFTSGKQAPVQDSKSKVWRTDEEVTGYAEFRLPPRVEFSRSKITFKGIVTTKTEDARLRGMQRVIRTEKYPILSVVLTSSAWPDFESDNGVVNIPFRFNLDECSQLSSTNASGLPPSVNSRSDSSWWSGMKANESGVEYDITYSVVAACYGERDPIASKSERITILPVAKEQPPLYSSHYAGEHFLATPSARESRHSKRDKSPRLQLASQEPEPIYLDSSSLAPQGSTQIPCVLKLLPQKGSPLNEESPPEQCEMTARLVTRTLVTPNGVKRPPTVEEVANDQDSFIESFRSNGKTFTISIKDWQLYTDNPTDQFAITKFPLLFNLGNDRPQTPSFFTPILSRRYTIEIKLRFPETNISNLELSVPLQIAYEPKTSLVKIVTR